MAITSLSDYYAAARQQPIIAKTAGITTVANSNYSVFVAAGEPGAGTLAGTSTAAGVVPTDATAGCPNIVTFTGSTGYLNSVEFANSVTCRVKLFDMLFKAGAYSYAAATTSLSAQPGYSSRIPGGTDYNNLQIWIEVSTNFATGNAWSVVVTYTDQEGGTGHSTITTGSLAAAGLVQSRMYQLALAAGDRGVQKIESVVVSNPATAMTAGAFNVLVLRPLWEGTVAVAGFGDTHGPEKTGMPVVFADSALVLVVQAISTSTGSPYVKATILDK